MKHFRLPVIAAIMVAGLALGSCAQQVQEAKNAWAVVTGATITPQQVYIAANAFDAVQDLATVYLRLPTCGGGATVCKSASAVHSIVPLVRSGRLARNKLEAAVQANPGAPVDANLFSTLTSSTGTLKQILAEYGAAQ